MSATTVAYGGGSTLNPNAPLFVPAVFRQVEDFSPQWWELVKTTSWFRDHWFHQHQEQETFDGEDDYDVASLLPDLFDLGFTDDDLPSIEADSVDVAEAYNQPMRAASKKGQENDMETLMKKLSLLSPKDGVTRRVIESPKYREKPLQCMSPKYSPRRVIHQPR